MHTQRTQIYIATKKTHIMYNKCSLVPRVNPPIVSMLCMRKTGKPGDDAIKMLVYNYTHMYRAISEASLS